MKPTLIFCAAKNKRYVEISINAGFLYGAQLPNKVYYPPYFVDQDWKNPNLESYVEALKEYQPYMASVMDWERPEQLPEILKWAEAIVPFVEVIMIVPKVQNSISSLKKKICGKSVRLGYSVPTIYGGTALPYSDFIGWPIHLLGGSPHKQMKLTGFLNVVSIDGNMHMKMAELCTFWSRDKGIRGHWIGLNEIGDNDWGKDAPYEAFRRSCVNIMNAWNILGR